MMCSLYAALGSEPAATEVRAVWLTTNYGLDWPRNRTNPEIQKQELISILDSLKSHNFNTVMFQVRARGEVFYDSEIEPMSSLIASGGAFYSSFDPLAFAIEESHKRGLECHAWLVTYPLGGDRHVSSLGSNSVTKKNPTITKKYKNEWFLDPGNPRTDDYLLSIIKEIIGKYDVDGIHFDYIRYPSNTGIFPDDGLYKLHGNGQSRADWRRDNITRFVSKSYDLIKSEKPWVQVSSAPLGRYRVVNDRGRGWTAFETVFQDAGKWMQMGIHDALYPMMYYKNELFYPYLDDWQEQSNGRILVPGLGAYQMIELKWTQKDITDQIDYSRNKKVGGQAYFRTENILSNTNEILIKLREYYQYPAKLPPMTWLSDTIPDNAYDLQAEKLESGVFELKWQEAPSDSRVTYNVYRSETDEFCTDKPYKLMATELHTPLFQYKAEDNDTAYYYYVTVSDSFNNESGVSTPAFFYHSETIK